VVLNYQYNPAGQRTEMAATIDGTPDFVDDYSYNAAGQVISVTEHGVTGGDAVANKEIDLTYNDAGELATVDRYQDGVLAVEGDYTYDSAGDLTGLVYHQDDTVLASYAWTYSGGTATLAAGSSNADWLPSGGIVPVHDTTGVTSALMSGGFAGLSEVTSCTSVDGTANYSYDPTGELLAATYTSGQVNEAYSYDANGNRTNGGYVTGADNRLLSDGTYWYAYDAEGNRTEKFIDANHDGVLDAGDTDVTEFTWDNRDRLTEVKTYATEGGDPTEVVDYLYDVENRWIGENIDSNGTEHQIRFAYDGNQIVLQFDKDGSGQLDASSVSHRYTWLPGAVDQLMSDEQADKVVWTLGDNQGTIKDLAVMDSGVTSIVNHRVFDSLGNLVSQTNSAVDCLFGYTGRPLDSATGLQNNLNRWYDSSTGGWISKDPTGLNAGDTNLYRYVGNSPTNGIDPKGTTIYLVTNGWHWWLVVDHHSITTYIENGKRTTIDKLKGFFALNYWPGWWPGANAFWMKMQDYKVGTGEWIVQQWDSTYKEEFDLVSRWQQLSELPWSPGWYYGYYIGWNCATVSWYFGASAVAFRVPTLPIPPTPPMSPTR
jgi:RHS repeat-associated protein